MPKPNFNPYFQVEQIPGPQKLLGLSHLLDSKFEGSLDFEKLWVDMLGSCLHEAELNKKKSPKFAKSVPAAGNPSLHVFLDKIARSQVAGCLLLEIQFRSRVFRYARKDRSGVMRYWVKLTRNQWMRVAGLTRHQYDHALAKLKKMGLVTVEYM